MSNVARRILSVAASAATVLAMMTVAPPDASAAIQESVSDRIAGADRYNTAALIADRLGPANAVVIANGENAKQGFDALSANYLAGRVHAPILLSSARSLSPATLASIKEILAGSPSPVIYVIGGTDSISDAVVTRIRAVASSVSSGPVTIARVGGASRYVTSALVTARAGAVSNIISFVQSGSGAKTAILASGQVNADALAAGPLSYAWGIPVLLASSDSLSDSVLRLIETQHITQFLVLGGADRISPAVLGQLSAAGVKSIKRIAGSDRFDTAAQLYSFAMDSMQNQQGDHYGVNGASVFLANGITGFPDALAAGPLAGSVESPLITVPIDALPPSVQAFLTAHQSLLSGAIALGSAGGSVSDLVFNSAAEAVGSRDAQQGGGDESSGGDSAPTSSGDDIPAGGDDDPSGGDDNPPDDVQPPVITTTTLPSATVGETYSATLATSDGRGGNWTVAAIEPATETLPPGLVLDGATISGTPTEAGTFSFTLTFTDDDELSTSVDVSIDVAEVAVKGLEITLSSLPDAGLGVPYGQSLTATGGVEPYTWSIVSGDLPAGLELSEDGVISGTPTETKSVTLTIQVADSAATVVSKEFSMSMGTDPGVIQGTVTAGPEDEPVASVTVDIYEVGESTPEYHPMTNVDGSFRVDDVPIGSYVVCFDASTATNGPSAAGYFDECHDGVSWLAGGGVPEGATSVDIVSSTTYTVDAQLREAAGFTGTITDASGAPLAGVQVTLFDVNGASVPAGATDDNGVYEVTHLEPGQYDVCFDARNANGGAAEAGYASQCVAEQVVVWPVGSAPVAGSIRQTVAAGELKTIDLPLTAYWAVTGTVTDTDGNPLSAVRVSVVTTAGEHTTTNRAPVYTAADGAFVAMGLTAGSYVVCFDGRDATGDSSATGYVSQCLEGVSWGDAFPPPGEAATIPVVLGTSNDLGAIQLVPGGSVDGTVTDESDAPLPGVGVEALSNTGVIMATAKTDEDGSYRMSGIPAGRYAVCFDGSSLTSNTVPAGFTFACAGDVALRNYDTGIPSSTPTEVAVDGPATADGKLTPAVGISGLVSDADGTPLPHTHVTIRSVGFDVQLGTAGTTSVGADGRYTFRGLPAATYQVCFDATNAQGGLSTTGYVSQCWDNAEWASDGPWPTFALPVVAAAGTIVSDIDAVLQAASSITGTVTDGITEQPLQGVAVHVWSAYGDGSDHVVSSALDGTYAVRSLPPGRYVVCFDGSDAHRADDSASGYASTCDPDIGWDGLIYQVRDGVEPRDVLPGTTTEVNAALHAGGAVSGIVTEAESGDPIADVTVYAFLVGTGTGTAFQAKTGADGRYVLLGLDDGDYVVCFAAERSFGGDSETGHLSVCYEQIEWAPGQQLSGEETPVAVEAGSTAHDIDATLTVGAAISGTVTGASGEELDGVFVRVYDVVDNGFVGTTTTGANGTYIVEGVPPGKYRVCFDPDSATGGSASYGYSDECFDRKVGGYASEGDPVTVVAGRATAVDAALTANWEVTGAVADSAGNPIMNARVQLLGPNYTTVYASTGEDGVYHATGAKAGPYAVCVDPSGLTDDFAPQGYVATCYGGGDHGVPWIANTQSPAGVETVSPTRGESTSGTDITVPNAGGISGTVSTEGDGIERVSARVFDTAGNNVATAWSDENGDYSLTGLVPDVGYRVCFTAESAGGAETGYTDICYSNGAWDGDFQHLPSDATLVTVDVDVSNQLEDQELTVGAGIRGTVTAASDGHGIEGASVSLYQGDHYVDGSSTDESGAYAFRGLRPGEYVVCVDPAWATDGGSQSGYLATCRFASNGRTGGTLAAVTGTEWRQADVSLAPGAAVAGVVTGDGSGIGNVGVAAYDDAGDYAGSATTRPDGSYLIVGLPTGNYQVCFDPGRLARSTGSFLPQCYGGQIMTQWVDPSNDLVAVTEGSVTPGIGLNLTVGAAIAGTVTGDDTDGQGISGISVSAYLPGSYSSLASTQTDDYGNYTLALPGGRNVAVCFQDFGAERRNQDVGYVDGCFGGAEVGDVGAVLAVTGLTTSGVDVALQRGGAVTGSVTDTAVPPAGLSGVQVVLIPTAGDGNSVYTTTSGGNTWEGPAGSFKTPAVSAGTYYVCFQSWGATGGLSTTGYVSQCAGNGDWDGSESNVPAGAMSVSVEPGRLSAVDAVPLQTGGAIAGRVTDDQARPLDGVSVLAYPMGDDGGVGSATTRPDGSYMVTGLVTGDYEVCFYGQNGSVAAGAVTTGYVTACYGTAMSDEEAAVPVELGRMTENIDMQLALGAEVDGVITDSTFGALGSAWVAAFPTDGGWNSNAYTDDEGGYKLKGLVPGAQYQICAFGPNGASAPNGYLSTCYPDVLMGDRNLPGGTAVTAPAAGTVLATSIDIALPRATP
jgi:putative cell wall-binding protein/protocatechuate 3,4-dioxygenase beta subunit